jgi:hypothetical protein
MGRPDRIQLQMNPALRGDRGEAAGADVSMGNETHPWSVPPADLWTFCERRWIPLETASSITCEFSIKGWRDLSAEPMESQQDEQAAFHCHLMD